MAAPRSNDASAFRLVTMRGAPVCSWALPAAAWALLIFLPKGAGGAFGLLALAAALLGTVFTAVYHAEVIAHRIGEPFGTLVLAIAVTIIEVALIVSILLSSPEPHTTLARDTVFAAVMIVCNGVVGLSLVVGGGRFGEPEFRSRAAASYLAVLGRARRLLPHRDLRAAAHDDLRHREIADRPVVGARRGSLGLVGTSKAVSPRDASRVGADLASAVVQELSASGLVSQIQAH